MKNLFYIIITAFVAVSCQNSNNTVEIPANQFVLKGQIEGLPAGYMLRYMESDTAKYGYIYDTIKVQEGGIFEYQGIAERHELVWISPQVDRVVKGTSRGYFPAKSSSFMFIVSPGNTVEFTGKITDFVDAYPSGTPENDDIGKLHKEIFPIMNESLNILVKLDKGEIDSIEIDSARRLSNELSKKATDAKRSFVQNNPTSIAALAYLEDMMIRSQVTDDEAEEFFAKMKDSNQNVSFYKAVEARVLAIQATKEGSIIPSFTSSLTFDSSTVKIEDYRGKYVVIDFWGTWCGPCVAEMPTVKEYAAKYPEKLQIIGIASESSPRGWKNFLERNDYNWPQVLSDKRNNDLISLYNVQGFPTKLVIAPDGTILKRFVGGGEAVFEYLDELMQEPA